MFWKLTILYCQICNIRKSLYRLIYRGFTERLFVRIKRSIPLLVKFSH